MNTIRASDDYDRRRPRKQRHPSIGMPFWTFLLLSTSLATNNVAVHAFQSVARAPSSRPSRQEYWGVNQLPHRPYPSKFDHTSTQLQARSWEGDDVRWIQKFKRRIYRQSQAGLVTPVRTTLIVLNIFAFLYQSINTIHYIRLRNPQYWPSQAGAIVADTIIGSAVRGPFTSFFVHSNFLSARQPHRYLTAGFLHADLIHLVLNMDALRRVPSWLETGLGRPLFVTTFLVSIITGNIGHTIFAYQDLNRAYCLGASGGICGLYGLMYVALNKMGKPQHAMQVLKSMLFLVLCGFLLDSVSNAAHVGGFLGGVAVAILCAPGYHNDYGMRRKNSLQVDLWPRDYRSMMGFGINPTKRGILPVAVLWAIALVAMAIEPKFQSIPSAILRGLLQWG